MKVTTAIQSNVPVQLQATGHVAAFASIAVRSQVSGVLESVHFKEGSMLNAGDLLFTIDSRPFRDALARAKSDLAKDLGMQKQAAIERDENAVLLKSKIISQDSYNECAANAQSLAAVVEADKAAVDLAELDLSYCQIHSSIGGRAGFFQVSPGNLIPCGELVLVTIKQTRPIFVDFPVPERNLPAVRQAAASGVVEAEAMAYGQQRCWTGELTTIDNTIDADAHSVVLRARFGNEGEALWPGQTVHVLLKLPCVTSATLVPRQSVQTGPTGHFVFVVNQEQVIECRPIETGDQLGDEWVVCKGLQAGDRVVCRAPKDLGPGSKVRAL